MSRFGDLSHLVEIPNGSSSGSTKQEALYSKMKYSPWAWLASVL